MGSLADDRPRPVLRSFPGHAVTATALALVLAACGGGGSGRSPISTPPPAPAPTPAPAPPPPVFLTAEIQRSDGPEQHGAVTAWQAGRTGAGQTIAIIDTGIDTGNSEFAGRIHPASADVTGAGRTIQQEDDHGTNVALIAAAARNNSGVVGIAYDARVLVLRADTRASCADTGGNTNEPSCTFNTASVAAGIDAAVAAGARVVNISLGGNDGIGTSMRLAVGRAAAAGVVIVVAAGNDGEGDERAINTTQPSAFASQLRDAGGDNVIIVGAVDEGGQRSVFSQPAGSAQAAWYLSARGERVCCVYEGSQIFVGRDAGGAYNLLFSGTSFATPQVAGAVALLAQAFPNLTGREIVRLLLDTARDAGAAGVDAVYGAGILDIARAFAPRGALTLAGGTMVVSAGSGAITGSPAMGDAPAKAGPMTGVALDSYARAYNVDLGRGARGAGLQPKLGAALAEGARVAGEGAGPLALAYTVSAPAPGAATPFVRALRLTGEESEGARLLAARAALRIAPGIDVALGFREGTAGLAAQLRGAEEPAFLIAAPAVGDSGFARGSDGAAVLRREVAGWGLSGGIERGQVWRGYDLGLAEMLPGAPREPLRFAAATLGADRRFGPVTASLGASWLAEERTLLGARFAPGLGFAGADSLFLDASGRADLAGGWQLGAAFRQGWSRARAAGLIADFAPLTSNAWSFDVTRADTLLTGDSLAFRLSQPLRVTGGGLAVSLPVAWDYATLRPSYGLQTLALAPEGREIDAELAWQGPLWGGAAAASLYWRQDPGHYAALPADKGVAVKWSRAF
ncbi:S8 family peptidase [Qipengyuania sediminis]|uniref:S8 family peptidase n=1 Tax=Qipengyuania sediminis TaxID=1532023 RepID=UPI001059D7E4|nr:S8 family peptidase [Qipengyuania sediminis]